MDAKKKMYHSDSHLQADFKTNNKRQSSEAIDSRIEKKVKTSENDSSDDNLFNLRATNRFVVTSNAGRTPAKVNTGSSLQSDIMSFPINILTSDLSSSTTCIEPKNVEMVGSYNWDESQKCGILVPGIPAEYSKPYNINGVQLYRESGLQMIDENHYRQPKSPVDSLICAVDLCTPSLNFQTVDFVSDRNNMRKLLRFLRPNNSAHFDQSFTILLDKIDNLCVFTRVEQQDKGPPQGFGHSFEERFTKMPALTGIKPSAYRRIVKYDLADITLMIRTEVDAVQVSSGNTVQDISHSLPRPMKMTMEAEKEWERFGTSELNVFETNSNVIRRNIATIYEFKTKNNRFKHEFDWLSLYYQMIIGDVNRAVIGWLNRGKVELHNEFSPSDIITKISSRERSIVPEMLSKLTQLLEKIRNIANSASKNGRAYLMIQFDPSIIGNKLVITKRSSNDGQLSETAINRILRN